MNHCSRITQASCQVRSFILLFILESNNGREFKNQEIKDEVIEMWPGLKMVNGKPRHSQSQGSVERANRDVENLLACWHAENNSTSKWHKGINRQPAFGLKALNLPDEVIDGLIPDDIYATIIIFYFFLGGRAKIYTVYKKEK